MFSLTVLLLQEALEGKNKTQTTEAETLGIMGKRRRSTENTAEETFDDFVINKEQTGTKTDTEICKKDAEFQIFLRAKEKVQIK